MVVDLKNGRMEDDEMIEGDEMPDRRGIGTIRRAVRDTLYFRVVSCLFALRSQAVAIASSNFEFDCMLRRPVVPRPFPSDPWS